MILENNIRVPQIIAVVLEGIALFVAVLVVLGQRNLLGSIAVQAVSGPKIPPAMIGIILHLILYIAYLIVIHNYNGRSRRGTAAFFIIAVTVINLVVPLTTTVSSQFIQRLFGAASLAAWGMLSSYVSGFTVFLTTPAAVLFYISCGRYGISKVENFEDPAFSRPSYSGYTNDGYINNDQGGNQ